ncbi:MAG: hypothetical protein QXK69_10595 [Candidatus Caldarchaeum sp.]
MMTLYVKRLSIISATLAKPVTALPGFASTVHFPIRFRMFKALPGQ